MHFRSLKHIWKLKKETETTVFHATTLINFNSFINWIQANPFFPLLVNRIKPQLLWKRAEMPTTCAILACTKPVQVHLSVFTALINVPDLSTKNSISMSPGLCLYRGVRSSFPRVQKLGSYWKLNEPNLLFIVSVQARELHCSTFRCFIKFRSADRILRLFQLSKRALFYLKKD